MPSPIPVKTAVRHLTEWFQHNKRDLPWRKSKDAYRVWISEVMLQQTTTQAVIPFYEKFLTRFPTAKDLAKAPIEEVLKYWAGLGYYSRARNLHKASQELAKIFPKTAAELIELPGFGPYTSRAVASIAFEEQVGVLDGNVIRVLSRIYGKAWKWWLPKERDELQDIADQMARLAPSSEVNQALMELGATVCTPQSPSCFICPWNRLCIARKEDSIESLPLKKLKTAGKILLWKPRIYKQKNKLAFTENTYAPFLKGSKIFPGEVLELNKRPEKFDYKHTITKYEIYTQLQDLSTGKARPPKDLHWLHLDEIPEHIPYSLVTKALKHLKLI